MADFSTLLSTTNSEIHNFIILTPEKGKPFRQSLIFCREYTPPPPPAVKVHPSGIY